MRRARSEAFARHERKTARRKKEQVLALARDYRAAARKERRLAKTAHHRPRRSKKGVRTIEGKMDMRTLEVAAVAALALACCVGCTVPEYDTAKTIAAESACWVQAAANAAEVIGGTDPEVVAVADELSKVSGAFCRPSYPVAPVVEGASL
jgi:hypothetical protein